MRNLLSYENAEKSPDTDRIHYYVILLYLYKK